MCICQAHYQKELMLRVLANDSAGFKQKKCLPRWYQASSKSMSYVWHICLQTTGSFMDNAQFLVMLSHWNRVKHICVSKIIIIGSDNGLSPARRRCIIWTNAGILLIGIWEYISKKYWSKLYFHSRKCIWKCRLQNGVYFVSASMC